MPDLRERLRVLDSLDVPDIMARAREMGPSVPAPESAPLGRRVAAIAIAAAIAVAAILLAVQVLPRAERVPADEPTPPPAISYPDPCAEVDCVGEGGSGNVDATITLAGSRCTLDGADGPIAPGTLKLKFVNDSHHRAAFGVVRLVGRQTVDGLLRPDPGGTLGRRNVDLSPSTTRIWSSVRSVASSSWAVICRQNTSEGGVYQEELAGVAGPIEIK